MSDVYKFASQLDKQWEELEELTKTVLVFSPECPLATRRESGRVRLVYGGKPLCECKATERVEAVKYIPQFLDLWFATRQGMGNAAKNAVEMMEQYLKDFATDTHQTRKNT